MEVTAELFTLLTIESKHTRYAYPIKILDTGFLVETKIKRINSRNLEEKEDEEKEPIDIVFTEQKQILIMIKILLTLNDRMYTKKTRKILLWLTSLKITKAS